MQLPTALLLLLGTEVLAHTPTFAQVKPRDLLRDEFSSLLLIRQAETCLTGEVNCGTGCMPSGGDCCSATLGQFCDPGDSCTVSGGCCPKGEVCTGPPTGCKDGKVLCGTGCIPEAADCCSKVNGDWCEAGTTCSGTDSCSNGGAADSGSGGGSGGDDDDDSSGGSGGGSGSGNSTCGLVACKSNEVCYQNTICCPSSNPTCGGPKSGGGDDDEDGSGGGGGGGGGAGALNTPTLGLLVIMAIPLLL